MTAVIGAHEERDEMSSDVPNDLIQTEMHDGNEWAIMNITGALVD